MKSLFQSLRFPVAAVVAIGGVSWACWTLFRPAAPRFSMNEPNTIVVTAPPPKELPELSEIYSAASISRSCAAALASVTESLGNAPELADRAGATFEYFLRPTLAQYEHMLKERGDKDRILDESTPSQKEEYFRTVGLGLASQTPDFSKLEVRVRYLNGRKVNSKEERSGSRTIPSAVSALADPEASLLTAVELIFPTPISTRYKGVQQCRIGIVFGKTKARPYWVPMQARNYDVNPTAVPMLPIF